MRCTHNHDWTRSWPSGPRVYRALNPNPRSCCAGDVHPHHNCTLPDGKPCPPHGPPHGPPSKNGEALDIACTLCRIILYTQMCALMHTHQHACADARLHRHAQAHAHAQACMHTDAQTYAHARTRTQALPPCKHASCWPSQRQTFLQWAHACCAARRARACACACAFAHAHASGMCVSVSICVRVPQNPKSVPVLCSCTCTPAHTVSSARVGSLICSDLPGTHPHPPHPIPDSNTTYLRGLVLTGLDGVALFQTIIPGWYPPRAVHIHVKVRSRLWSYPLLMRQCCAPS